MLNTFPDLLSLSFIAPLVLRTIVGAYFLKEAYLKLIIDKKKKVNTYKVLTMIGLLGGIFLITGFFTQITSIILIIITISNAILISQKRSLKWSEFDFYILLIVVLISLIFTGAGFYALDLPL
ncbi:MAG: hypothetical protein KAR54_01080 [Candidatus Pacebacteria bacterium]|nr:hypothetical protein [Candidatus Paceibacterota bacterium]